MADQQALNIQSPFAQIASRSSSLLSGLIFSSSGSRAIPAPSRACAHAACTDASSGASNSIACRSRRPGVFGELIFTVR